MRKFLFLFALIFAFMSFGELTVDVKTAPKSKIKNHEQVVTNVTISGTAGLDTNTVEGASVAEIRIRNEEVRVKAKNPDLEGADDLNGMVLFRLNPGSENINYANCSDQIVIDGVRYRYMPLMSAIVIDKKLNRRLPKWTSEKAEALPELSASSTPADIISGFNAIRQFLVDNTNDTEEEDATVEDGPAIIGGKPLPEPVHPL